MSTALPGVSRPCLRVEWGGGWRRRDSTLAYWLRSRRPANQRHASNVREWLQAARADVLFEASSLNATTGQPALDHIRAALELGAHAITANKDHLFMPMGNYATWLPDKACVSCSNPPSWMAPLSSRCFVKIFQRYV